MESLFISLESEDTTSTLVAYGLYLGALFQIICLLSCIFLPDTLDDVTWLAKAETEEDTSEHSTPHNTPRRPHFRARKVEKKKRR